MSTLTGTVFNIQHFSIQDGKGIRTTVFLKGCPLKCIWCANPESQRPVPELEYIKASCIQCKNCKSCDRCGAITENKQGEIQIDFRKIANAEDFREVCPAEALQVIGQKMSVKEVVDKVEEDSIFYKHSFGGMTLSGGEPLMQPGFSAELLEEARRRYINTNIETTGFAQYENVKKVFSHLDSIIYDIKLMDDEKHKFYTGVSNRQILDNFKKMRTDFSQTPVVVRTPVIPGVNDNEKEILAIRNFISNFPNVTYELLKFHRLGQPKYEALGREWEVREKELSDEKFEQLKQLARLV